MFAGQGKLMIFAMGTSLLSIIGLLFLLIAPQSGDPIRTYAIGFFLIFGGGGGGIAYYAYNWTIVYTKWRSLGMLLRPGWGRPTGEIWVINEPVIELLKDLDEKEKSTKKKQNKKSSPQIEDQAAPVDISQLETMIPDETKNKIAKSGGRFHYYLVTHTGDTNGRDMLISVNPIEGMFEYFPEEAMVNDFPRRLNIAYGTGSLIGRHDIYIAPLKPKGWKKIKILWQFRQERPLYDSVRVWLIVDSNLHGWRVKYDLGLETPNKDKVEGVMNMIQTIDAASYIDANTILKSKIKDLEQKLLEKLTWEARYSPKHIYEGDEDSLAEKIKRSQRGSFWNWQNIGLIIAGGALIIFLLYMVVYQGAFSLESIPDNTPINNTNINASNTDIPIIGGE